MVFVGFLKLYAVRFKEAFNKSGIALFGFYQFINAGAGKNAVLFFYIKLKGFRLAIQVSGIAYRPVSVRFFYKMYDFVYKVDVYINKLQEHTFGVFVLPVNLS